MRFLRLHVPASVLALSIFTQACFSNDVPKYANVAFFAFEPRSSQQSGARAMAVLRDHGFEHFFCVASFGGMTISVPADRTLDALRLLATAIKAERLQLTLVTPGESGGSITVTPEAVLRGEIPR